MDSLSNQSNYIIERFHSRVQHLWKVIETKEKVYIRIEFNSHSIGLKHQHGGRFIDLGHQYCERDFMRKRSVVIKDWRVIN